MRPHARRLAPALLCLSVLAPASVHAAATGAHAIVNARIVPAPGRVIERGTVVVRDGVVIAVGANVVVPDDVRVWNGDSLTVYAGMIELFWPAPERGAPPRPRATGFPPATAPTEPEQGATHPLPGVTPERRVAESLSAVAESLAALRRAGFAVAHLVPANGIVRGQSVVAGLANVGKNDAVLRSDAAQIVSLEIQPGGYPGSLMGAVAVVRQAFMDARWYQDVWSRYQRQPAGKPKPVSNVSWAALGAAVAGTQPVYFETHGMLEVLRAAAIAREARVSPRIVGSGDEYKRAKDIAAAGVPLIVPVNFPDAPELETADDALEVSTPDLRHWHDAPGNAAVLANAGARFALSAHRLRDPVGFRGAVAKAIERGLAREVALAAVTTVPAELLGLADRLGTIAAGKAATFTVTRGELFDSTSKVVEIWVDGVRQPAADPEDVPSPKGNWDLAWGRERARLIVQVAPDTVVKLVRSGDTLVANSPRVERERLRFSTRLADGFADFDVSARDERLLGTVDRESGRVVAVRAPEGGTRGKESDEAAAKAAPAPAAVPVVMGDVEAWRAKPPAQPAAVLIRNATIWTVGLEGTLENSDLLIRSGKIGAVGTNLKAPAGAIVVDGAGKHVMPGILDAHSHSAILGDVNECTNIITAEVRIADVVNSESIEIYRQLAGGTTIMHLLHGSCNSIGGQCAVIKNRWGDAPDRMLMVAPPTIKFALGENPKRSNVTGTTVPRRYPDTRAGVEQSIRDAFTRARDYGLAQDEWRRGRRPAPPRRDLQLDAVLEILRGERLIHAHSYRQDEILALIRLCEEFDVTLQTLQHILEGYKIADEMASHGASASAFSDWWAYKFEVIDAIPHNGYLMWDRGVSVSYNSDSNDLARRLNTEAAKAIKYGGVPPEEAIKFVTLNPAQQLRIDDRVGSIEAGKDADFSIWSGTPLSPYSLCEQTWIDGRKYFDRAADLAGREALAKERESLIAKARAAAKPREGARAGARRFGYLEDAGHDGFFCEGEDGR